MHNVVLIAIAVMVRVVHLAFAYLFLLMSVYEIVIVEPTASARVEAVSEW